MSGPSLQSLLSFEVDRGFCSRMQSDGCSSRQIRGKHLGISELQRGERLAIKGQYFVFPGSKPDEFESGARRDEGGAGIGQQLLVGADENPPIDRFPADQYAAFKP